MGAAAQGGAVCRNICRRKEAALRLAGSAVNGALSADRDFDERVLPAPPLRGTRNAALAGKEALRPQQERVLLFFAALFCDLFLKSGSPSKAEGNEKSPAS